MAVAATRENTAMLRHAKDSGKEHRLKICYSPFRSDKCDGDGLADPEGELQSTTTAEVIKQMDNHVFLGVDKTFAVIHAIHSESEHPMG